MCIVAHRTDIPVAPSATYFRLNIDLLHLLPLGDRAPTLSFFTLVYPLIFKSYAASRFHPHIMAVGLTPHPPTPSPFGLLAIPHLDFGVGHSPWRVGDLGVNEAISNRYSVTTLFPAIDPSSIPPTTLAVNWSNRVLPSTHVFPKLCAFSRRMAFVSV